MVKTRVTLESGVLADGSTVRGLYRVQKQASHTRTDLYRCTVTVGTFEARSRSLVLLPRNKLFSGDRL